MKKRTKSEAKSAIAIARLLSTEGFTDHTANEVKRYALRATATEGQKRRWNNIKKAFGEMSAEKLNERDKLVLGRFISFLLRMNFDAGLRVGLTAFLNGARVDPNELEGLGGEVGEEWAGKRKEPRKMPSVLEMKDEYTNIQNPFCLCGLNIPADARTKDKCLRCGRTYAWLL